MKPKLIFLFRHGQSEGNVNKNIYSSKPDYALELTTLGKQQAFDAGLKMAETMQENGIIASSLVQFYVSSFWRTRQTFQEIKKTFPNHFFYEEPRLREQEWGHLREDNLTRKMEEYRDNYGHFYYRFDDGESCADVYNRMSTFLETLFRDFEKTNFPETAAIVTHGMTLRVFLMRWFHMSVEDFELIANPGNAQFYVLKLNDKGKYDLTTPQKQRPVEHSYQFRWD